MSKIAKAISYKIDRYEYDKPPKLDYTTISYNVQEMSDGIIRLIKYRIGLKIETSAFVEEGEDASSMIQCAKQAMIEEIFGEFRPMIYNLRASIYDRDFKQADKLLLKMHDLMFKEGVQ